MNNFTTIYEMAKWYHPIGVLGMVAGIAAIVVGLIWVRYRERPFFSFWDEIRLHSSPWLAVIVGSVFFTFSLLLTIVSVAESHRLVTAYENGQCEVLEGVVHVLHTYKGETDVVSINGKRLEIRPADWMQASYAQLSKHGSVGALKEGEYARVYTYNGKILKIEVRNANSK